jgi:hypothetical protein
MGTRFNHLNVPQYWQQYWDKYPQGYTILESLLNWVAQVDSMTDNQNDLNTTIEAFTAQFDKELQTTVSDTLKEWQDSGFLDIVISDALQTQITDVEKIVDDAVTSVKSFGAKGDGVADDTIPIQNAIDYVATRGKRLFFPSGTYLISNPLKLPTDADKWGIELSGLKSETKYQYLPGSKSTVIKATAPMSYMLTNRDISGNAAYYSVVKNLVLDGNNVAQKGYITGWQDKLLDSTVIQCTQVGVSIGDLSNMTIIDSVTMALNTKGFESVASDTTVFYIHRSTIRENTGDGGIISSSVGAVISDTIFESNGGRGLLIQGTTEALKRVTGLKLDNCYWENNTDYAIEFNRLGSVSPRDIEIVKPWLNSNSGKALNIQYVENLLLHLPNFVGSPTTPGYIVNENGLNVEIKGDEIRLAPANLSITGANAGKIFMDMAKNNGSIYGKTFNQILKSPFMQPNAITLTNGKTLQPNELAGTILTNTGQAGDLSISLPVPTENYRFRIVINQATANSLRVNTDGQATIFLDGYPDAKAWIEKSGLSMGDCIEFMAFTGDNYYWIAKPIRGNWSAY